VECLSGADAVAHLAAIPAPGLRTEETTFRENIAGIFNVFEAAVQLKLPKVVWASSETTIGLPFDAEQPAYAPIDENHPLYPESSYALSKVLGEEMARQYVRRFKLRIACLRFSNIMEPQDYAMFPGFWKDAKLRKWNLWGYVDARDVAQGVRLALEKDLAGAPHMMLAATDTVMDRPSADLMAEVYPKVRITKKLGEFETLLSIDKARELLGYKPAWSWRNQKR
jgi:nucleoside-diphosphate-sugar epimerase